MNSRALAREQLAERARKQKLTATDRAVLNLNRYYGSELTHSIQDMAKHTRHKIYTMEFNRKNFLEERRRSLADIVLVESPQKIKRFKYFRRRKKSDAELMGILDRQEKRKNRIDLLKPDDYQDDDLDLAKIKKFHPIARVGMTRPKQMRHGSTFNNKAVLPPIDSQALVTIPEKEHQETDPPAVVSDSVIPEESETGPVKEGKNSEMEPTVPTPVQISNDDVQDPLLTDRSVSSKKQSSSPVAQSHRQLSTRTTNKSDPYNAMFSSYLHPVNFDNSSNENLLYMLALNEEEIETYELKRKQDKLKRHLRNQCKDNGKIDDNAREWMKKWDEERRSEMVEEALKKAAEAEERERRRKEREKERTKKSKFTTYVYSSDEEN